MEKGLTLSTLSARAAIVKKLTQIIFKKDVDKFHLLLYNIKCKIKERKNKP